jgi:hypothetical protein
MVKKLMGIGAIAVMAFAVLAPLASADSELGKRIDFRGGMGGTVSFTMGMGNSFSVLGAPLTAIEQFPSNEFFSIVSGALNLTTGPCELGCTTFNKGSGTSTLFFDDGGSFTITGEVPSLGINSVTTLVQGTFDSFLNEKHETSVSMNAKTGRGGINGYLFVTSIDPALAQALKLLGGQGRGFLSDMFFNLTFNNTNNSWGGNVNSTDLIVTPLPEPSSLLLLGSGLLGVAGFLERKRASGV